MSGLIRNAPNLLGENGYTVDVEDRIVTVKRTELQTYLGGGHPKVYVTANEGSFGEGEEVEVRFFADPSAGYKIGDEFRVSIARVIRK